MKVLLNCSMVVLAGLVILAGSANGDPLFVGNTTTNQIIQFDTVGNSVVFADAAKGVAGPVGMVFDSIGNLYVANNTSDNILKFDSAGHVNVFADANSGLAFPSSNTPVALAIDPGNNLFVANPGGTAPLSNSILRFDPLGHVSVFADTSDTVRDPRGLAFDSTGKLYVANQGFPTPGDILRFDSAGNGTLFAGDLFFPGALAFDALGNLFVANLGAGQILRLDPLGNRTVFAGGVAARAMAFDSAGNLFVGIFSATEGQILRFDSSGNRTVFAEGLAAPNGLAFPAKVGVIPGPSSLTLFSIGMLILLRGSAWLRWRTP